ncbi:TolC family outer membrane protein [Vibrio pectenicida]|uniref:TolC family outer membrane protein n=1 Tax=Vibrio pectenicida TaxID=62763 RepID=A0A7Y3ZZ33_9VIBR|nr:TolC family outer membrane protein [Vibrio pectenicida]NOH71740.1 TolC family outer membrane protein [Vibrio pectenicida]
MIWKRAILTSSIALVSFTSNSQTLEQAVAITIATSPELKSTFNQYKSALKEADASVGSYLPRVDLDAGVGREYIEPTQSSGRPDTELTRKEASVTLTQLLWDGNATLNDMSRTASQAESSRLQLWSDASDLALQVAEIYLEAVKAHEVLLLSESNLAVHKDIYRDIKKRADSGIGSTADVTQVEARIAKAHGNLLAAQNNLIDTHTEFRRIVGQSPMGLIYPRADESKLPLSLEDALQTTLEDHPVIKISQADVDSARYQYKQSKGSYYPTISVEASQTWREDAGGNIGSSDESLAMLRLSYNLYNGGSDKDLAERNAYQLNRAKDLRDDAYRQVEESMRLSWSALDLTLQQKNFLSDHVDSASETVIAYKKQYQIGQRTLLDLLNTENELFDARKDYLDAHYSEQYAKYRVMNASGKLLNTLLVDVPQEWLQSVEY